MRDTLASIAIQFEKLLGVPTPPAHVLCYHSVSKADSLVNVTPTQFKSHIRYILRNFEVVTLGDVVDYIDEKRMISKPIVALTFDDGYRNLLSIAPYLHAQGIIPTIFVTSRPDEINRAELDNRHTIMSMNDVKLLHDTYGWEIGCHTATHPNLLELEDHELQMEVVESKKELEDKLNVNVRYFAYPKGYFNAHVAQMCQFAKYHGAFSTNRALISMRTPRYRIHRLGIDRTTSGRIFPFMFTYSALVYFGTKQFVEHVIKQARDSAQIIERLAHYIFVRGART
jgi:peptidoglycan/xylan/chitin deacetylase (PgdA/CDA1 family)